MPVTTALTARSTRAAIGLRVLVAVALGVSAYLHYDIAEGPLTTDSGLTLAALFIGQAVVATIVALWVLIRGDGLSMLAAFVVGLGSLAALVLSTYMKIPAIGPLPSMYDPLWYGEKVVAAVAAGAATLFAAVALARLRRNP